jgi:hypothetical protein
MIDSGRRSSLFFRANDWYIGQRGDEKKCQKPGKKAGYRRLHADESNTGAISLIPGDLRAFSGWSYRQRYAMKVGRESVERGYLEALFPPPAQAHGESAPPAVDGGGEV